MFITELSIKRPAFSWVLSLILVLFGTFVFWKLPVRELPSGLQPPVVQINVEYASASSQIVDEEVTQVLEEVIGGAEGIKNIPVKNKILLMKLTSLTLYDILYFNYNISY